MMLRRHWRTNWMVVSTGIAHGIWGIVLMFSDSPMHTTAMAHFPIRNHFVASAMYCLATILAMAPHVRWIERFLRLTGWIPPVPLEDHFAGLLATCPQQILLLTSGVTVLKSVLAGRYADGYVPNQYGDPHLFIFLDQSLLLMVIVFHTISLLDWYVWSHKTNLGSP